MKRIFWPRFLTEPLLESFSKDQNQPKAFEYYQIFAKPKFAAGGQAAGSIAKLEKLTSAVRSKFSGQMCRFGEKEKKFETKRQRTNRPNEIIFENFIAT